MPPTSEDFEALFKADAPPRFGSVDYLRRILYACIQLTGGDITKVVPYPASATAEGEAGHIGIQEVSGIIWLAIYIGDGTTHQWGFVMLQTNYPT